MGLKTQTYTWSFDYYSSVPDPNKNAATVLSVIRIKNHHLPNLSLLRLSLQLHSIGSRSEKGNIEMIVL